MAAAAAAWRDYQRGSFDPWTFQLDRLRNNGDTAYILNEHQESKSQQLEAISCLRDNTSVFVVYVILNHNLDKEICDALIESLSAKRKTHPLQLAILSCDKNSEAVLQHLLNKSIGPNTPIESLKIPFVIDAETAQALANLLASSKALKKFEYADYGYFPNNSGHFPTVLNGIAKSTSISSLILSASAIQHQLQSLDALRTYDGLDSLSVQILSKDNMADFCDFLSAASTVKASLKDLHVDLRYPADSDDLVTFSKSLPRGLKKFRLGCAARQFEFDYVPFEIDEPVGERALAREIGSRLPHLQKLAVEWQCYHPSVLFQELGQAFQNVEELKFDTGSSSFDLRLLQAGTSDDSNLKVLDMGGIFENESLSTFFRDILPTLNNLQFLSLMSIRANTSSHGLGSLLMPLGAQSASSGLEELKQLLLQAVKKLPKLQEIYLPMGWSLGGRRNDMVGDEINFEVMKHKLRDSASQKLLPNFPASLYPKLLQKMGNEKRNSIIFYVLTEKNDVLFNRD